MSHQATLSFASVPALSFSRTPRVKPVDPPSVRPRVKTPIGSVSALEIGLRRAAHRGQPVVLGSVEDPYTPAAPTEDIEGVRSPLAALARFDGLEVAVTTRSPEILRDMEALLELDRRCAVTVDMLLAAADPFLVRRIEPQAAEARARLLAVARLAAEGIAVRILCTPLSPGLNDSERALRQLFAAAREAGAQDVLAGASADCRPTCLARLRGVLHRQQDPADFDPRLAVFRRLRLEHGFPRPMAGRG
jgi:DNA repair photolyase